MFFGCVTISSLVVFILFSIKGRGKLKENASLFLTARKVKYVGHGGSEEKRAEKFGKKMLGMFSMGHTVLKYKRVTGVNGMWSKKCG